MLGAADGADVSISGACDARWSMDAFALFNAGLRRDQGVVECYERRRRDTTGCTKAAPHGRLVPVLLTRNGSRTPQIGQISRVPGAVASGLLSEAIIR